MSLRYPGGLITKNPVVPSTSSAAGIWTLEQALEYIKAGTWPSTGDPYFAYVTMLLHGNGTNGAQNNTFLDSSTNNFTITRNGNTTQGSFSPFSRADGGWSNYFDGVDDYLSIPNNAALQPGSGDFTVEFWAYNTDTAAAIDMYYASGPSGISIYRTAAGKIEVAQDGIVALLTGATTVPINQWNHIAIVRSGTTLRIYLNGAQDATITNSTNFSGAGAEYIGTGSTAAYPWPGYLSNLRIVKGTAVYTAAFTPPTTPLTAITNTSLLTCQSNRFIDNSTNAFTITPNGNPSVQAFGPFNPTTAYTAASNGGSGYFDGSGDYLTLGGQTNFAFGTGDFTVEAWVYRTGTNGFSYDSRPASTNGEYLSFFVTSSLIILVNNTEILNAGSIPLNAWTHVAVSRSGSSLKAFVNGSQVGSTLTNTTNFQIGASRPVIGANGFDTTVTNVTGYNSGLRVLKGTALYTANFTPPTAPLTAITNTSLLCNFTNAGIFDSAAMNDLETVNDAQISTAQSKFGGGSIYIDGAAPHGYLSAPSSAATFLSGDYTIEAWVYRINATGVLDAIVCVGDYNASTGLLFYVNASGQLSGFTSNASLIAGGSVSATTWTHVAIVRSGTGSGNTKLYINGTSVGTPATSTVTFSGAVLVGASRYTTVVPQETFSGYIDEVRISRYARYTANFTPPIAPFPDK